MNQIEQYGLIFTIVMVLAFYLRLIILQYGKAKRINAKAQQMKKGKKEEKQGQIPFFFGVRVVSWPWVIAALALMGVGAVMAAIPNITTPFWWLPMNAGIIILWIFLK
jgi:hypothetical protein